MKKTISLTVQRNVVCAVALLAACTLLADDKDQPKTGAGESGLQSKDKTTMFIKEAMQGNAAEVALAEVAERKAQNAEVKQFAEHIRKDHTEANQKLQPIAQKHGISESASLDAKHQKTLDKFQQLSGDQFDQEYAKEMLKDHQKDIAKYQKVSKQAEDTEVKQYAQETLPKLREHLAHAEKVAKTVGIDQETISSFTKEIPEGVGGTSDRDDGSTTGEKKSSPKEESNKTPPRL